MFSRLSIKYRIAGTVVLLTAALLALALDRTLSTFMDATQTQLENTELAILMLLRDPSRHALLTEEYAHVRQTFAQATRDPSVRRVLLLNAESRVVMSTTAADIGAIQPVMLARNGRVWRRVDITNAVGKLGTLAIEYSSAPLQQAQRTARNLGVSVALTGMVPIALIGIGMGFLLTRRLDKVAQAAQRLADGKPNVVTGIRGQDEIAQVARAFDAMAQRIADQRTRQEAATQFFHATLDALAMQVAILDDRGIILAVNHAWHHTTETCAFFGASYGFGTNYIELCEKAEGPNRREAYAVATGLREMIARQRHAVMLEYPCDGPDTPQWFMVRVTCFDSADGLRLVVAHTNITELKLAEHELRQSETHFRSIVEASIQGICIHQDGIIQFVNPAMARLLGYDDPAALIGQPYEVIVAPHERARVESYRLARLHDGDAPAQYEYQSLHKDGSYLWCECLASKLSWHGKPAILAAFVNITPRKQAEAALQEAHAELERRVQERTAALTAANDEVRRFAYIVSHDLRAPLINLKGFAAELRHTCDVLHAAFSKVLQYLDPSEREGVARALEEDGPEALAFIDTAVTRMDRLIQAVLVLSRIGRRELHMESVDTQALLEGIVQSIIHQLTQHRARIITIGPLPEVRADRTALEQIFANLLDNAVTYLHPGRDGDIVISAESDADCTTFHVQDNGRGIDKENIPKVFELFRRVGEQNTTGEGIGLAYVQALVRRHGGSITCQSTPGVGTTFSFTISHYLSDEDSATV